VADPTPAPAPVSAPAHNLGPRQRWTGRGRGTGLGFAIFFHAIRLLGHRAAYLLIAAVLPYFILFAPTARRASRAYLRRALGARGLRWQVIDMWRHFRAFARSMVDDMLLLARREGALTYSRDGFEQIRDAYDRGQGVILLSAHVGNRGLAGARLDGIKANIVAFDNEARSIRRFLDRHRRQDVPNLIEVSDGPAAAVSILSALKRGELVAMLADRSRGDAVITVQLLGSPVDLPAGPFLIAVLSGAPALVTFAPKLGPNQQHFYARPLPIAASVPRAERREHAERLAHAYARELEAFIERWPYQWYNFYDYFGDAVSRTAAGDAAESPRT
jgi:predicted LPLAT superfamily acyltransferase